MPESLINGAIPFVRNTKDVEELNDLSGYSTVLVIGNAEHILEDTANVVSSLQKSHDAGVYINVNQPYQVLKRVLEKRGVETEGMYFIDCITKSAGAGIFTDREDNCLYITSPSSLTELSIAIMQTLTALGDCKKFVFIDSLGTFLLYNSLGSLSKFSHFLITKMSLHGVNGIFMSVEKEMDEKLISELKSFCEKTIKL